MQIISSKDNEIIKDIRKLKDKKYREQKNQYIVEGIKLIQEAINEEAIIDNIVVCEECLKNDVFDDKLLYEIAKHKCIYVTENVFKTITEVNSPQGVLAVIDKKKKSQEIDYNEDIIVVLDGVQDPGNLGTILRTVDSCNIKQIVISKQSADSFNPKVVRSTMGAIFRVKVIETDNLVETLKEIKKNKFKIVATSLQTDKSIYDVDFSKKAIIIGNEANGVSKEVMELADIKTKIPMLRKNRKFKCVCCDRSYFV